jgi:cytochrome c oxidase cbb3-type subunit 3
MRWSVVAMVFGLVACGGDKGGDVVGDPVAGEEVYATNCAVCHADDGSGGTGPSLIGEDEEAEIIDIVTNGEGDMQPYGDILTEQEIADVAAFVVSL